MEKMSPTAMTEARGLQSAERERIMGVTPTAAAMVVRNMGRRRRCPASVAASSRGMPLAHLLLNIIDEDDCISHHDAAYADQADKCHETEGVTGNQQSDRCTEKGQRYG